MGGKSRTPQYTTQTTRAEPPAWQVPYIKRGLSEAENWFDWIGTQQPYPSFPTVAPFTPLQTAGQEALVGAAGQMVPQIGQYQGTALNLLNPYSDPLLQMYGAQVPGTLDFLSGTMAGVSPGLTESLNQMMSATPNMAVWGPLMNNISQNAVTSFQEEVLPSLRTNAMLTGQFGTGSRPAIEGGLAADRLYENILQSQSQLAQAAASEALQQRTAGTSLAAQTGLGAAAQVGGMTGDIYSRLAQNQLGALGLGGQTLGYGLLPGNLLSQIGTQQQAQQQAQISDDVSRFMANLNFPLQNLGAYQGLVTGNVGGTTTAQTPHFPPNPLMAMLGGASLGAGIGSFFAPAGATGAAAFGGWPFLLGGAMLGLM